jgi:hypothetical protein
MQVLMDTLLEGTEDSLAQERSEADDLFGGEDTAWIFGSDRIAWCCRVNEGTQKYAIIKA